MVRLPEGGPELGPVEGPGFSRTSGPGGPITKTWDRATGADADWNAQQGKIARALQAREAKATEAYMEQQFKNFQHDAGRGFSPADDYAQGLAKEKETADLIAAKQGEADKRRAHEAAQLEKQLALKRREATTREEARKIDQETKTWSAVQTLFVEAKAASRAGKFRKSMRTDLEDQIDGLPGPMQVLARKNLKSLDRRIRSDIEAQLFPDGREARQVSNIPGALARSSPFSAAGLSGRAMQFLGWGNEEALKKALRRAGLE